MKIVIYVNGKYQAERDWPAIPRIGEKITVFDGEKVWILKIKDIIWGSIEENWLGYQDCTVSLYCRS